MKKRIILLAVYFFTLCVSAQHLPKRILMFELSGLHQLDKEEVDQGIPDYQKTFSIAPKVGFGFNLGKDFFGYLNLGYGYTRDSTRTAFIINNAESPVEELLKVSTPIIGLGFKKYFKIGNSPIYFNTDIGITYSGGKVNGTLHYSYVRWGDLIEVDLVSHGQQTNIEIGVVPGLAVIFDNGFFVDLGVGFAGYKFSSQNLEYSDGFDQSNSSSVFKIDLSAASIKFRAGYLF